MSLMGQAIPGNDVNVTYLNNTFTPQYEYFKEKPNNTFLEIKEVTNGYIITATSHKSQKALTRVCNSDEDLMEEIAKILVELKLTTGNN